MSGLELLNPRGLWLLAGVAPIVALYILKIRRRRQRVPSTVLWAVAQRDLLARRPFRKLLPEVPLVLQLAALALLTVAFSRPAIRGGGLQGDHVCIVIDTSASMATVAGPGATGHTRMDEAKAAARDAIDGLSVGADAFVIEAGKQPRVVSALERDVRRLRRAVDGLAAREVEGDLAPAVAMAADRLRSLPGRHRVLVVTDGALAHPEPLVATGADVQVVTVGDARDNAAIVRVDVREGLDPVTKRDEVQAFAVATNYADGPRDAYVTATIEGQSDPIATRRVLLPPHDKVPVVLTFEPSPLDAGKGLTFELSPHDALSLDDFAFGRVPGGRKMPVVLASRAPYSWVARALDADPDVGLQRLTPDQLATVNVDPDALVVLEGLCPPETPGRDLVVVAPPAGRCAGIDVGAPIAQPLITSWDATDPRMRFLTLDGVHVSRANALSTAGLGVGLVRAGESAIVADSSLPGRQVTVLGFDPGDTDWPLKASFVLFVRNLVEIARQHRAVGAIAPARTGEPLRFAVPAGVVAVGVEGPAMADHQVEVKEGFAVVTSVERAGLYHVRWTSPHIGAAVVAVNLTSEAESDVRTKPLVFEAEGGRVEVAGGRSSSTHRETAAWVAIVAALVLALDVLWFTRRGRRAALAARTES